MTSRLQRTRSALFFLKQARALLRPKGTAPQTLARVRAAIKSAEGAVRHAEGLEMRAELARPQGRPYGLARLETADLRNARDAEGDPLDGDNLEDAVTETPEPDSSAGLQRERNARNPLMQALKRACSKGDPIVEIPTPEALAARAAQTPEPEVDTGRK